MTMLEIKKETDVFGAVFTDLESELQADARLSSRRRAFERFSAHGFPTPREEAWKYTSLSALAKIRFTRAPREAGRVDRAAVRRLCFGEFACNELVFVNGRFSPSMSSVEDLPAGAHIGSLAAAYATHGERIDEIVASAVETPFDALNAALTEDGAFVYLPRDTKLDAPLHLVFVVTATAQPIAVHPRNVIVAEAGSKLSVVETYVSDGGDGYFTNAVTHVSVGESARVDHFKLQREALGAWHIADTRVVCAAHATFQSFFVATGGAVVRNEIHAPLTAEDVTCKMYGLYLLNGEQHCDCHTVIDHAKPRCKSEQVYKGILDGRSHGVFSGTVHVSVDAQKTDAHQSNKNLLLSEDALINTRPQLEIHADDVKCTHGVAIGSLDETQLFYLRSRGIGPEEARDILTYAFASELLSKIDIDAVRADVEGRISAGLAADSEEHREDRA